jgi:hypothetical protein
VITFELSLEEADVVAAALVRAWDWAKGQMEVMPDSEQVIERAATLGGLVDRLAGLVTAYKFEWGRDDESRGTIGAAGDSSAGNGQGAD